MDERRAEVQDAIRFRVWSGYYRNDEVFDIVYDEEGGDCDEELLRHDIDQEFRKKREAEQNWPAITDCDRLDRAFVSLREQGILTRHRCGLTIQDGLDVIEQLYGDEGGMQSVLSGYCFYHIQDMEAAMWGEAGLRLAFGSFPPSHEQTAHVGQLIRDVFEQGGLPVEWDSSSESQMLLKGFRWQRRRPDQDDG